MIFLSVVDDLMAAKGDVGALVTRARAGVELQIFRSVKDVFDSLVRAAADYTKDQWIAMTARVQNSLQSRLKEIEKFVVEMLEIPEWGLVRGARVVAVPRIEAVAVEGVRVPNPLEVRTLERVRLSFDVQMTFHAILV